MNFIHKSLIVLIIYDNLYNNIAKKKLSKSNPFEQKYFKKK